MKKIKDLTNDQMIKNLLKDDLTGFDFMILRERLVKIAEITLQDIKTAPEKYDNFIFNHTYYVNTMNKVLKHCGFENENNK